MKHVLLCVLSLTLLFLSCKKYNDFKADLDGDGNIRGRLFLHDTLTGKLSADPLAEKIIILSYSADGGSQPIITVSTDKQGYFTITNLNFKNGYHLTYDDIVNNKRYYADTLITHDDDSLALYARLSEKKQNGFYYLFVDKNEARIANCSVCVFSSASLARPDTCAGSTWQLTSDSMGRVSLLNIPAGTYYLRITTDFPTLKVAMLDTVRITQEGILKTLKVIQ